MKIPEGRKACFPSAEEAAQLITANDWAFYILNRNRMIGSHNFYKLYLLADSLPAMYGAPEEMQKEITGLIFQSLKNLR